MEYVVTIRGDSPFGTLLLGAFQKIGGASASMAVGVTTHPLILARDLDSTTTPGFVRLVHLQNPGVADQAPREAIVPSRDMLFAHEHTQAPAAQSPAVQDQKQQIH